jgi:hypothetical protein
VDDPTECKLTYLRVVSHPAGETVAHLIDKFLQRRFAQRLCFAWFRSRPRFGYVVAALARSVPPHPFRGGHWLRVRVTNVTHVRDRSRRPRMAVHSFFHTLIAASVVAASANSFTMTAAVSGKFLAPVTVGAGGQTIRTAAGMSAVVCPSNWMFRLSGAVRSGGGWRCAWWCADSAELWGNPEVQRVY